jgi:uncharacterized membrane protein (UPF0127 family)
MTSFLNPLVRGGATGHVLVNVRTRAVVADRLLTAFDSESRRRGLLGRDGLPPGTALIIAPSNAVHTFFMRFPIDVAFVARDGRVIKVRAAVPPWRMTASLRGFTVIEFAAGTLARSNTIAGDSLICEPADTVDRPLPASR